MEKSYDVRAVMELLPHRYPFILIDRVLELVPGERVVALKNVTINEGFFAGHFPGNPILPGVLMVEAMGQAGCVLVYESLPEEIRGNPIYLAGMDKVKFRKTVVPGDQVILELTVKRLRKKAAAMTGTATVNGQRAAQAELMAIVGERP